MRTRTEKGAIAQKLVDLGVAEAEEAARLWRLSWAEHKKNGNEHGDAKRPVTRGQDDHLVHDEESIVVNKPDAAGARAGCVQRTLCSPCLLNQALLQLKGQMLEFLIKYIP